MLLALTVSRSPRDSGLTKTELFLLLMDKESEDAAALVAVMSSFDFVPSTDSTARVGRKQAGQEPANTEAQSERRIAIKLSISWLSILYFEKGKICLWDSVCNGAHESAGFKRKHRIRHEISTAIAD